MKNFKFLSYLLIAASSLVFMQCTSDYTAINGQDGIDGENGMDGIDGIDGVGVQVCTDCHANEHRDPINDAYAMSRHSTGSSWARGTSASCAQCHNNEGYIDYLSGLFIDEDGVQSANPNGYSVSNAITCTGCHTDHRSFDFENDGNDYALRNIDPVKLVIDPTVSIDLANTNEPLGLSNACVTCHQPRPSYPVPAGTDDIIITSYRYGPHHGPQSTLFEGVMGANIAGSEAYPGIGANGDNSHRKGISCVGCHMDGDSGHSWEPSVGNCVSCHSSMTAIPTQITAWSDFDVLHDLLVSKKFIGEDGYVLGDDGVNRASSSNPLTAAVKDAQAIWNYKTLEEDKSNGIHNPKYTKALLKNTLEYLQNN